MTITKALTKTTNCAFRANCAGPIYHDIKFNIMAKKYEHI